MNTANQYDGPCWKCGTKVPALHGTYNREHHRSEHVEGQCKTTTKTWKDYQAAVAFEAFRAANLALYTDAGYAWEPSPRVEHPDVITGNGLRVLVGGDKCGDVFGHGVRVYRDGQFLQEYPKPHYPDIRQGDYYEHHLNMTRALIALIDAHKS